MTNKKTSYPPVNIGTSLMLVVFIILCMVVFAVLSLSGSLKDRAFSESLASRTENWYEANNQAEEILANIDRILSGEASDEEKLQELQNLESVTVTTDTPANQSSGTEASASFIPAFTLTYAVPIDDNEVLQVTLSAVPHNHDSYTIISWQQLSIQEWNGDATLPVLGSEIQ